jgi:hypothetical protein
MLSKFKSEARIISSVSSKLRISEIESNVKELTQ